jgi:putative cell wall-binding protein
MNLISSSCPRSHKVVSAIWLALVTVVLLGGMVGSAFADEPAYFLDTFDTSTPTTDTRLFTPGVWTVDRYAPASFESTTFNGQGRLHVGISTNDSQANRPVDYAHPRFNTQGRNFLINTPAGSYIAGDLYIGSDWATHNRRADLWAAAYTTSSPDAVTWPVIGFVHDNSAPASQNGFRVWTDADGWVMVPTPAGFTYGSWHNLRIEFLADCFRFFLDGKLVYTDRATSGASRLGLLMLQAYNFGDESYDVYWDNIDSHPIGWSLPSGRVPGADNVELSVAASRAGYTSARTVILSTNRTFTDAMSAAGLAGVYHSPILLTDPSKIPTSVIDEIKRLGATKVVITGGTDSIAESARLQLVAEGLSVQRIGGKTRYDTSVLLAQEIKKVRGTAPSLAFVARGDRFPDALSASSIAYANKAAIMLTRSGKLPVSAERYLKGTKPRTTAIIGSYSAVSKGVEKVIAARVRGKRVVRLSGRDRYATSIKVAKWALSNRLMDSTHMGAASGTNFAGALVGGPAIGEHRGVLVIVPSESVPEQTTTFLRSYRGKVQTLTLFGEPGTVADGVLAELLGCLGL